jgi:hypothetical protein
MIIATTGFDNEKYYAIHAGTRIANEVEVKVDDVVIQFFFTDTKYSGTEPAWKIIPSTRIHNQISDYTFRDYGKLKNFGITMTTPGVFIPKSYLQRLKTAPKIPVSVIKENIQHIYAISYLYSYILYIIQPKIKIVEISIPDFNSFKTFYTMLDEQQVIGLFVELPMKGLHLVNFLLLVDDDTKVVLNKLIYIYSNIKDFLKKHNISLKDILEDIDLYVSVAAVAATAT